MTSGYNGNGWKCRAEQADGLSHSRIVNIILQSLVVHLMEQHGLPESEAGSIAVNNVMEFLEIQLEKGLEDSMPLWENKEGS